MTTAKKTAKKTATKTDARPNYKVKYLALQRQVEEVHRMLDAAECPPNCGTLNGRMIEFAKDWLRRCGEASLSHPATAARAMLRAVDAPQWPL